MNRIEDVTNYITECDKEVGEALEELEGGAVHVVPRKKKYIWDLIQEGMITRTCIKSRKPFLFRFRRWEILKRQNYAKNGLPKFATRHSAQTGKFRKPNA